MEQIEIWDRARRGEGARSPFTGRDLLVSDTVGAIAVDLRGRLAAGSSTGGVLLKMPGRVGDAAIFGAGIYADARQGILCSGLGEASIELALAVRTAIRFDESGDAKAASLWAIERLISRGATGGIVLHSASEALPAVAYNATYFPVVHMDTEKQTVVSGHRLSFRDD